MSRFNERDFNEVVAPQNSENRRTPRVPGSNPNKDNAQRRKFNRPRTQNVPRGTPIEESKLKWVDPLPIVEPAPLELAFNNVSVPAGFVELRADLPETISEPFSDIYMSVTARTNLGEDMIQRTSEKLVAMSYYKACRQLYATMSDPQKSRLQPLKAVFYDKSTIPKGMSTALSMIGHLDTKFGRVEVKHAELLFKRWLITGLKKDPDVAFNVLYPEFTVFRDSASKKYIDELCTNKLKEYHDADSFLLLDGEDQITCSVPMPTFDANGLASIKNIYPHAPEMRILVSALMTSERDYIRGNNPSSTITWDDVMETLQLNSNHELCTDQNLRLCFEEAMDGWYTVHSPHVEAVFNMQEAPANDNGYAAQLVSSGDVTARSNMPVSDYDAVMGYLFNPNVSFSLNPSYIGYGQRTTDEARASFAKRDLKPFGSG